MLATSFRSGTSVEHPQGIPVAWLETHVVAFQVVEMVSRVVAQANFSVLNAVKSPVTMG